jgi:hypothetical protein
MRLDRRVGLGIVFVEERERTVGEHDAEAERRIGRVLLEHAHVHLGMAALEQIGKVETGGTRAEDGDPHASPHFSHSM